MSHVLYLCLFCSYLRAAVSVVLHLVLVVLFRKLFLHYHLSTFRPTCTNFWTNQDDDDCGCTCTVVRSSSGVVVMWLTAMRYSPSIESHREHLWVYRDSVIQSLAYELYNRIAMSMPTTLRGAVTWVLAFEIQYERAKGAARPSQDCIRKTKHAFCGTRVSIPLPKLCEKIASPRKISLKSGNRLLTFGNKRFLPRDVYA